MIIVSGNAFVVKQNFFFFLCVSRDINTNEQKKVPAKFGCISIPYFFLPSIKQKVWFY